MYIDTVPNRNSRPAILLREGWREGKKTRKKTIANLTDWPKTRVEALRRVLKDEPMVSAKEAFLVERSLPHGHVAAVLQAIRKIGLDTLIASKPSRERDLVVAMLAEQLLHPASKLATTRLWHDTTLAQELGVETADEDDLYKAMDWLIKRQERIEKKLAARHLREGGYALYDVTSSYYEGRTCPLACIGYNRDKKRGKRSIVYGVMCDEGGRPVAVEVYPGNTGDPTTVPDQVEKLRMRFQLERVVLVGDRGMLTETQLSKLKKYPGLGWISALRSKDIRALVTSGHIQLSLFDEQNMAEVISPDFPGERLVVCYNPLLAGERKRKREDLLQATEKELRKVAGQVKRRTKKVMGGVEIAKKVGMVCNRYKVGKHFKFKIEEGLFSFERDEEAIRRESELDGIYVVRTSEAKERLSAANVVLGYKNLTKVERLIRTLKSLEIKVRPIRHRDEVRVRAHILICLLAYYVEWHMRQVLASLLFDDEEIEESRRTRDPVAPARASDSAVRKKRRKRTKEELEVQSFETLLVHLGTMCKHLCRIKFQEDAPPFYQVTEETPLQKRVFELLGLLPVTGN